uniref:Uncharacterized protein n=1 Tax=Vespula pensylvanica TaxID=30213 RepID=A0A834NQG1_VESPE|nr:hypothetical protein H0235_012153 [Vespula pensylvanica]
MVRKMVILPLKSGTTRERCGLANALPARTFNLCHYCFPSITVGLPCERRCHGKYISPSENVAASHPKLRSNPNVVRMVVRWCVSWGAEACFVQRRFGVPLLARTVVVIVRPNSAHD